MVLRVLVRISKQFGEHASVLHSRVSRLTISVVAIRCSLSKRSSGLQRSPRRSSSCTTSWCGPFTRGLLCWRERQAMHWLACFRRRSRVGGPSSRTYFTPPRSGQNSAALRSLSVQCPQYRNTSHHMRHSHSNDVSMWVLHRLITF